MEKTVSVKTESDTVKVAVITSQNKIVTKPLEENNIQLDADISEQVQEKEHQTESITIRTGEKHKRRFNAHKDHTPSDETDAAITFINSQNLGWKADVCKLQKHHADYGAHCEAQERA